MGLKSKVISSSKVGTSQPLELNGLDVSPHLPLVSLYPGENIEAILSGNCWSSTASLSRIQMQSDAIEEVLAQASPLVFVLLVVTFLHLVNSIFFKFFVVVLDDVICWNFFPKYFLLIPSVHLVHSKMSFSFCVPLSDTSAKQNLQIALVPLNESFFGMKTKKTQVLLFFQASLIKSKLQIALT